jgi:hypothetical protein
VVVWNNRKLTNVRRRSERLLPHSPRFTRKAALIRHCPVQPLRHPAFRLPAASLQSAADRPRLAAQRPQFRHPTETEAVRIGAGIGRRSRIAALHARTHVVAGSNLRFGVTAGRSRADRIARRGIARRSPGRFARGSPGARCVGREVRRIVLRRRSDCDRLSE